MRQKTYLIALFLIINAFVLKSCGPVVISSRPEIPPPSWFYPNRVESVRYVYFPEYMMYYDLTLRNYIYLNNNVWIRVNVLPSRYKTVNLNRSRFVRIKNYHGDNIKTYHSNNIINRRRSTTSSTNRRRN